MHPPRHFHLLLKLWSQFGEMKPLSYIQVMHQERLQKEKETSKWVVLNLGHILASLESFKNTWCLVSHPQRFDVISPECSLDIGIFKDSQQRLRTTDLSTISCLRKRKTAPYSSLRLRAYKTWSLKMSTP